MESSELINNIQFKHDITGFNLFYKKYKYKISTKFVRACNIRYVSSIDQFEKRLQTTINMNKSLWWNRSHGRELTIEDMIVEDGGNILELRDFVMWRSFNFKRCKVMIVGDDVYIYFNDHGVVSNFLNEFPEKSASLRGYYRIKLDKYTPGVIYQVKPKYKYRLYLVSKHLDYSDVKSLRDFFVENNIRPCPSLETHLNKYMSDHKYRQYYKKFYIYWNNFIDFNDESFSTLMALKYPEIIKNIYTIEQR